MQHGSAAYSTDDMHYILNGSLQIVIQNYMIIKVCSFHLLGTLSHAPLDLFQRFGLAINQAVAEFLCTGRQNEDGNCVWIGCLDLYRTIILNVQDDNVIAVAYTQKLRKQRRTCMFALRRFYQQSMLHLQRTFPFFFGKINLSKDWSDRNEIIS